MCNDTNYRAIKMQNLSQNTTKIQVLKWLKEILKNKRIYNFLIEYRLTVCYGRLSKQRVFFIKLKKIENSTKT